MIIAFGRVRRMARRQVKSISDLWKWNACAMYQCMVFSVTLCVFMIFPANRSKLIGYHEWVNVLLSVRCTYVYVYICLLRHLKCLFNSSDLALALHHYRLCAGKLTIIPLPLLSLWLHFLSSINSIRDIFFLSFIFLPFILIECVILFLCGVRLVVYVVYCPCKSIIGDMYIYGRSSSRLNTRHRLL